MALFRKKKREEEDPTSHKQSLRSGQKASQGGEMKSVRRRRLKKMEPPKPWGKKERFLVLVVLLLTLGTSSVLALSARNWKLPGLPRIKFQLPSFSLLKNETITIEGDEDRIREVFKSNEVISKFREMTNELSGVYGLYVVNLDTGFSLDRKVASFACGVNENEIFQAASLIKLPVMVAMYMSVEDGSLDLSDKYELKNEDKISGAGSLHTKPEGYEITYRDLIRLMGQQSDNTAYNIAKNMLGVRKINETINLIGMKSTDFAENETTPKDIGLFFQKLWEGSLISDENSDELLDFLTDGIYEEWLAAGIPNDIQVAHKYGREMHVVNDAGIVFANKPFVVVIMSKGVVEREADKVFPELTRMVYEIETK